MRRLAFGALIAFGLPALAAEPPRGLAGLAPLSAAELGQATGRGSVELDSVNAAIQSGNSVGANSVTGHNTITNSLSNNSGITTVFQNSGNNSLFQSATSVTINVR